MIDKRILNYRVTAQIGKGGMATVYEAVHVKLDNKVAIKVLNPELVANDKIKHRFLQEAKIMASLSHDHITKVIDYEDQGCLAILMEHLEGQTLNDRIKQKGAFKPQEAIPVFTKIVQACGYAHSKGIVHRDLKPSNIFITHDGRVKIMDFGIAKIVEGSANVMTKTGTQMGTPVYMSPEQVHDSKHLDHLSDIYSLGVVLWVMLTGQPPYDVDTSSTFAIYKKIDAEPLASLSNAALNAVVQKATAKDKSMRFRSCDELVKAFDEKPIIKPKKKNTPKRITKPSVSDEKTLVDTDSSPKHPDLITVQGGTYTMGSNSGEDCEKPTHRVTLSSFGISKYEITNAQYATYMNAIGASSNGSVGGKEYLDMDGYGIQISYRGGRFVAQSGKGNHPVVMVTWYGANAYCQYYGGRLPTEAEWEFAARGGNSSKGYQYSGSNAIGSVAWYDDNSANPNNNMFNGKGTHPVGTKNANELGIHDMSGNVWEWCSDWWDSDYYSSSPSTNPQGSSSGSYRVHRGGGWSGSATHCRVANRDNSSPSLSDSYVGFRLAVSL